jgi:hypothetical protein
VSIAYIRRYYGVPAKRGGRVEWRYRDGTVRPGTITSATAYVYIRFDDEPRRSVPLHPKENGLVYLDSVAPDEAVTDG